MLRGLQALAVNGIGQATGIIRTGHSTVADISTITHTVISHIPHTIRPTTGNFGKRAQEIESILFQ